jgi:hypothetical protein
MPVIPINLAVEDQLSGEVARKALAFRPATYSVRTVYDRGGFGYLKKKAPAFNNASKAVPFLLLTDLDAHECAPSLVEEWVGKPKHPRFLLRVAVREVEAWLLGDPQGLADFLGAKLPAPWGNPEQLEDPKRTLLKMALTCPRRDLRDAIVFQDRRNGNLRRGPDYNGALGSFVSNHWRVQIAQTNCDSLKRLLVALDRLERSFNGC